MSKKPRAFSRREFLKGSSLLGSTIAINSLGLTSLLSAAKSYASNDYKALVFIFLNVKRCSNNEKTH